MTQKSITYQIFSHDPDRYGTVSFCPTIPWNTSRVEYKVTNLNTYCNFLITTKDDYLIIEDKESQIRAHYNLTDRTSYDIDELPSMLTDMFSDSGVTATMNECGCLVLTGTHEFKITECSHRVKLLLGLYNLKLPIESVNGTIVCSSTPQLTYANVLYLKSYQGNPVGLMINEQNYHAPCIYRVNQFLKPGLPVISNVKGDRIIVNAEAAKNITMELVDFMYEPIVLKSPMFVTLKMKIIANDKALY